MLWVARLPGWHGQLERTCVGVTPGTRSSCRWSGKSRQEQRACPSSDNSRGWRCARGQKVFPVSADACILICRRISCLHSNRALRRQRAAYLRQRPATTSWASSTNTVQHWLHCNLRQNLVWLLGKHKKKRGGIFILLSEMVSFSKCLQSKSAANFILKKMGEKKTIVHHASSGQMISDFITVGSVVAFLCHEASKLSNSV